MWRSILILAAAILGGCAVYLTAAVSRFGLIRNVRSGEGRIALSFGIVAALFGAFAVFMTPVDAFVIALHAVIFFLLFGAVFRLIAAVRKKNFRVNWPGWLAVVTTAVVLSAAYVLCHHVWLTEYSLTTAKDIPPLRVALIADSHIGTTFDGDGFAAHIDEIERQSPDLVLVAGDFVDDSSKRADMEKACRALGGMNARLGVWFAYGNHDKGYSGSGRDFDAADLAWELEHSGIHVLEDESVLIGNLCIVGRKDASTARRMELSDLLADVDPENYIIVIDHEPSDYEKECLTEADLVVSGHTHGAQLFPLKYIGEGFGINDRSYGYERRNGTDFIVTSGISCWAMDFKTGTKSEYVIITVEREAD
ncbi:MAG: serine/threonine protein phosphatase [Ruminococcaceae bacterium]|nr:serine/threonine protein phosphatase [Oscillospiraceae bacterium]